MIVAQAMRLAHADGHLGVVVAQFREHVERRDIFRVVVAHPLQPGNMADRSQRRPAQFPHALRDIVGRGEDLLGLLIEHQMIVAEVWTRDVPMKILRLHVERKHIGQKRIEGAGDVADGVGAETGRRTERRGGPAVRGLGAHATSLLLVPIRGG
jgi:hypothetical protein